MELMMLNENLEELVTNINNNNNFTFRYTKIYFPICI